MIVAHGGQAASGHEMGFGPIALREAVVIDLFPRDRETGCYADMTRTFVVGDVPEELAEYHRLVDEALRRSMEAVKAGVEGSDVYKRVERPERFAESWRLMKSMKERFPELAKVRPHVVDALRDLRPE